MTARIGRYELGRVLGEGGDGVVHEATLVGPGGFRKSVALKILHQGSDALRREARIGGLLRHRNLVDVYEIGEEDGQWFCALERCEGSLADHLPLPPRAVVEVGLQVCEALRYAHEELGLVHQDIKPANLLFAADGTLKVADLGIAKADGFAGDGRIRGTPGFMAPEQARGADVDARADVFGLGVTLLLLATGELPGVERTGAWLWSEGVTAPLSGDLPDVPEPTASGIPRWLAGVLDRCLATAREDRWQSMEALAEALQGLGVEGPGLEEALGLEPPEHRPPALLDTNLGPESDPLVGRAQELAELRGLLDRSRCITLRGPAGIGKSRLAAAAARRFHLDGHGQAWFIDLSEARTHEGLLFAVALHLGVQLGGSDPGAQLAAAIAARGPVVLVLDNFEQILALAPVVEAWADQTPEARWLVTSRVALGIAGEQVVSVAPLEPGAAKELLALRARARGVEVADDPALEQLARRLDGLPLALELAAGRLGVLSVSDVLERLGLDLLRRGDDGRHATLRAALDGSWALLDPVEQEALGQLSVFAGGFTLEAAEEVLQLPGRSVVDVVDTLVRQSMVRALDGGRFDLLASVQAYAAERLSDPAAAEQAHGWYFADLGTPVALRALDSHGSVPRRRALAAELDNLAVACRRAVRRGDERTAILALSAARAVLDLQGPHEAARALTDEVETLEVRGPHLRATLQRLRGSLRVFEGRLEEAQELLEAAEQGFAETADRRAVGDVLLVQGTLHRARGRPDVARQVATRALALFESLGADREVGRARSALGLVALEQGRMGQARALLEGAVLALRRTGDRKTEGGVLASLAILYAQQGQLGEARRHFEEAARAFRDVGSRRDEAIVLGNLANLLADTGRTDEALVAYRNALAVHREVGNRRFEGIALANLGASLVETERQEEARRVLERALAVNREVGDRRVEGAVLGSLGAVLANLGDIDGARGSLAEALAAAREVGDRRFEAYWLAQLARYEVHEPDAALERLDEGEALLRQMDAAPDLGQLLAIRAEVVAQLGQVEEAERLLAEAAALTPAGHTEVEGEIARVRDLLERL